LFSTGKFNDGLVALDVQENEILDNYTKFVCSILQLHITGQGIFDAMKNYTRKVVKYETNNINKYDIITFNYDTIIERIIGMIEGRGKGSNISLNRGKNNSLVRYCKLHGSIDMDRIIPPTWAKSLQTDIKQDWIDAHEILKTTNRIRIIGFSFPNTDSHISYLFKSAIIENENLKSIDVLCLDNKSNNVKEKYDSIFCTKKYQFVNKSVENYFRNIGYNTEKSTISYDRLEEAHKNFFC
jgi:hypothetical protein